MNQSAEARFRLPLGSLVISLLLAGSIVYQLSIVWDGYAKKWVPRVWSTMELPAWERAALYLGGPDFADYIGFIRQSTSPEARIILPPWEPATLYSNVGFMQYFLFPRDIHNCGIGEVEACVRRIEGANTYILALDYFPPRELASQRRVLLPFKDQLGLFGPP